MTLANSTVFIRPDGFAYDKESLDRLTNMSYDFYHAHYDAENEEQRRLLLKNQYKLTDDLFGGPTLDALQTYSMIKGVERAKRDRNVRDLLLKPAFHPEAVKRNFLERVYAKDVVVHLPEEAKVPW
jgi:hypothetical protein